MMVLIMLTTSTSVLDMVDDDRVPLGVTKKYVDWFMTHVVCEI
jgi:hypothetical protein